MGSFIKSERENADHFILLSQGDMWQGSVESNTNHGALMTEWMNIMGFQGMALGNHEFDWTTSYIKENREKAWFPFLAINVIDNATGKRASYCDASTILNFGDIQVGVIGAIGNCYSSISASCVSDVHFAVGDELTALVKAEATRLRDEGADFIIYSLHDAPAEKYDTAGYVYYDPSLSTGDYVDLVLEGHSHASYRQKDEGGVWHIQGLAYGQEIYKISFIYDMETGTTDLDASSIQTYSGNAIKSAYQNDEETMALMQKYDVSWAYEAVGYNEQVRQSVELRSLVAKLYYQTGEAAWGTSYPIVLGGGYLSCRSPYQLPVGDVNYAKLNSLFPFDNEIVLCSLSGSKLKSRFLNNADSNYRIYNGSGALAENIVDSQTYYIVTDTYNLDYSPNGLTLVARYRNDKNEPVYARDLLLAYAKENGFGTKNAGHAGTLLDPYSIAEAQAFAQDQGTTVGHYGYYKGIVVAGGDQMGSSGDIRKIKVADQAGDSGMSIYYLKKFDGATAENNWSSLEDVKVGDELVLYGGVNLYNSTPQFGSGSYAVTLNGTPTTAE